ncbi:ABC transporter permease [Methylophilaceae bacterium]|nr:ABC transporter permease [Methylophilaceae bacterium]
MKKIHALKQGIAELLLAFSMHHHWIYLATQDIRLRYRRSVLGPIWLTISTAITIASLTFLWSTILVVNLSDYVPYFATGLIFWIWVSTQILESSIGYSQFEATVRQIKLPFPIYILRICMKNFIILAHNFIVILIILYFIFPTKISTATLLFIPALFITQVTVFSTCIITSIICTRYRDVTQIIASAVQLGFFFTPILWKVDSLGSHLWVANYNPLFHYMSIIRLPLMGNYPTPENWFCSGLYLFISLMVAAYLLGRSSKKIALWL